MKTLLRAWCRSEGWVSESSVGDGAAGLGGLLEDVRVIRLDLHLDGDLHRVLGGCRGRRVRAREPVDARVRGEHDATHDDGDDRQDDQGRPQADESSAVQDPADRTRLSHHLHLQGLGDRGRGRGGGRRSGCGRRGRRSGTDWGGGCGGDGDRERSLGDGRDGGQPELGVQRGRASRDRRRARPGQGVGRGGSGGDRLLGVVQVDARRG